jgi:hypothetical protein
VTGCTQYSGVTGEIPCLACDSTIYEPDPVADVCLCLPGNLVNGVCEMIYEGQQCDNLGYNYCSKCFSRGCLSCTPDFYPNTNGSCTCVIGSFINGICNTIVGCIQPTVLPDGSKSCLACDKVSFQGQPTNNGSCQCLNGELVNGICN